MASEKVLSLEQFSYLMAQSFDVIFDALDESDITDEQYEFIVNYVSVGFAKNAAAGSPPDFPKQ